MKRAILSKIALFFGAIALFSPATAQQQPETVIPSAEMSEMARERVIFQLADNLSPGEVDGFAHTFASQGGGTVGLRRPQSAANYYLAPDASRCETADARRGLSPGDSAKGAGSATRRKGCQAKSRAPGFPGKSARHHCRAARRKVPPIVAHTGSFPVAVIPGLRPCRPAPGRTSTTPHLR